MKYILIVTLFILILEQVNCRLQWVDPHEMNLFDEDEPKTTNSKQHYNNIVENKQQINYVTTLYKRHINNLLNFVNPIENSYRGSINVKLLLEDYDFLKKFTSSNTESQEDLRKVDKILNIMLTKPPSERIAEFMISWGDWIYFTFYTRSTVIWASLLFLLFITYKLLKANFTLWYVFKYLIFLAWIVDFAFTWINLLQEEEISKIADTLRYQSVPPFCDPSQMSWWQYLRYSLSSADDCRDYHKTQLQDYFWKIAPLTVLSHQLGIIIVTPASNIGQALGIFTSGIIRNLPFGLNIILLPLILIFFGIIFCIIFSFITNTKFSCNFLHIFQVSFGDNERRALSDNFSKLLDIHRNMIEDVRDKFYKKNRNYKKEAISNRSAKNNSSIKNPIENTQKKNGTKKAKKNDSEKENTSSTTSDSKKVKENEKENSACTSKSKEDVNGGDKKDN